LNREDDRAREIAADPRRRFVVLDAVENPADIVEGTWPRRDRPLPGGDSLLGVVQLSARFDGDHRWAPPSVPVGRFTLAFRTASMTSSTPMFRAAS
jgi:hypothetical protein